MIESELDVLRDVSRRLEGVGIAFMLTGSLAMNYYAQPRMTRDIDLVISLNETQNEEFCVLINETLLTPLSGGECSISFTTTHLLRWVVSVLKADAYRQEEFSRRRQINIGDFTTWIVSREDLVLSKLVWAKDSKIRNAAGRCPQSFKLRL